MMNVRKECALPLDSRQWTKQATVMNMLWQENDETEATSRVGAVLRETMRTENNQDTAAF